MPPQPVPGVVTERQVFNWKVRVSTVAWPPDDSARGRRAARVPNACARNVPFSSGSQPAAASRLSVWLHAITTSADRARVQTCEERCPWTYRLLDVRRLAAG